MSRSSTGAPFQIAMGNVVEHHTNHILVNIDGDITRVDDRDVEGIFIVQQSPHSTTLSMELRDGRGQIATLLVAWACVSKSLSNRYCERVSECAAINVVQEYEELGFVERTGFRINDKEFCFTSTQDNFIVAWRDIAGLEVIGGKIVIWTGGSESASFSVSADAPNNPTLQKLLAAFVSERDRSADCKQLIGQLNCVWTHPNHPSKFLFLGAALCGAGMLRHGHRDLPLLLISLGILACVPLLFFIFKKLSERPAKLEIYTDCLRLLVGANRVDIPWTDLANLSVFNCPTSSSPRTVPRASRRIDFNIHDIATVRDPRYLFVQPDEREQELISWIRSRAKRERSKRIVQSSSRTLRVGSATV